MEGIFKCMSVAELQQVEIKIPCPASPWERDWIEYEENYLGRPKMIGEKILINFPVQEPEARRENLNDNNTTFNTA